MLGVALGGGVYVFNASREDTHRLCDVETESLHVTALKWSPSGQHVALATSNAEIQV